MNAMHLLRFLHTGNMEPCYVASKKKTSVRELCRIPENLECLKTLASSEQHRMVTLTIKKALDSPCLRRKDEALICIVYCLHLVNNQELRNAIHHMLPDILVTQQDLFLFAYYNKFYSLTRTGYGRGLRNAISKWYNLRTPEELVDMMGSRHVFHKWSHKDILNVAHPKIKDPEKVLIVKSAFQSNQKTFENAKDNNDLATMIAHQRLLLILEFKNLKDPAKAAQMIEKHKFPFAYLPTHLWKFRVVWEVLLPTMTYPELLEVIPRLSALKMLKPSDSLSKKFCAALSNMELIKKSKMHPISVYAFLQLYRSKCRYPEQFKETYYRQKLKVEEMEVNQYFTRKIMSGVNHSFKYLEPIDQDICVVINLRKNFMNKSVFGLKQLTCLDVSLLMALSMLHAGRNVAVMTYTEAKGSLTRVPLTKEMTYDEAHKICEDMAMVKTFQLLGTPLDVALAEGKKYNVFIVFVDSAQRCGRNGKPPFLQFMHYKTKCQQKPPNSSVRYIMVNLRRRKGDMKFNDNPESMGMMEIAGFDRNTPKIIEAFVKQQFV
ncbi:hypothetical protein DMENIID0001_080290 [Sergentomyia squamirostris]